MNYISTTLFIPFRYINTVNRVLFDLLPFSFFTQIISMKKYFLFGLVVLFVIFEAHEPKFNYDVRAESSAIEADRLKPELVMQTGHGKTVDAVIFSPNNAWVASFVGKVTPPARWITSRGLINFKFNPTEIKL